MDYNKVMKLSVKMFRNYTDKQIEREIEDRKIALSDAKRHAENIAVHRETLRIFSSLIKEFTKPVKWPKMPKSYLGQDGKRHKIPKVPFVANIPVSKAS